MNCPTCTALARLIHAGTYRCDNGHEFRQPKSEDMPTCLKCRKPRLMGRHFCQHCAKVNAHLTVMPREADPTSTEGTR